MTQELKLKRKWTFRAHGKQVVLIKKTIESDIHVLTKALVHRFRSTHLVFAKWNMNLAPFRRILKKETGSNRRPAPIDLISFPAESGERFIRRDGTIQIDFKDVNRVRC